MHTIYSNGLQVKHIQNCSLVKFGNYSEAQKSEHLDSKVMDDKEFSEYQKNTQKIMAQEVKSLLYVVYRTIT